MKVRWEINDGYMGGSRPHETEVDDDDLAECETEQEKENLIEEYVHEDFLRTVTWSIID